MHEGILLEPKLSDQELQVLRGMVESTTGLRELFEKLGELAGLEITAGTEASFLVAQQEQVGQIIDAINGLASTGLMREHFASLSNAYGIRSTAERLYNNLGLD